MTEDVHGDPYSHPAGPSHSPQSGPLTPVASIPSEPIQVESFVTKTDRVTLAPPCPSARRSPLDKYNLPNLKRRLRAKWKKPWLYLRPSADRHARLRCSQEYVGLTTSGITVLRRLAKCSASTNGPLTWTSPSSTSNSPLTLGALACSARTTPEVASRPSPLLWWQMSPPGGSFPTQGLLPLISSRGASPNFPYPLLFLVVGVVF